MAGSPRKATDEQLLAAYKHLGSLWAVADKFRMCGQSVHERLQKLHAIPQWKWTTEEDTLLIALYQQAGDNKTFLDELEIIFKRHKSNICRRARKLQLTNKHRKHEEILVKEMAERAKRIIAEKGHPKGMLGKKHSEKTKKRLAETSTLRAANTTQEQWNERTIKNNATRKANGTTSNNGDNAFSRTISGRRKDLDCFFRSKSEANYARFLNHLGLTWVYEPKTFFFEEVTRGTLSYTPDFYCADNDKWYEVKGWFDQPSVTRMKRFKLYYPEEANNLVIVAQSKKTYEQALALGYDVIRYEEIHKQYKHLPCWE